MGLLFLDFFTKASAYYLIPYTETGARTVGLFKDWAGIDLSLTLTMNHGAAWGLFSSFSLPLVLLRCLIVAALLVYLFFFSKERKKDIPFVLIITGALGNIIDYFSYGS